MMQDGTLVAYGSFAAVSRHACFHKLCLPTKLSDFQEWSQWVGLDLVNLKCAENNCVVTPILAYLRQNFYIY